MAAPNQFLSYLPARCDSWFYICDSYLWLSPLSTLSREVGGFSTIDPHPFRITLSSFIISSVILRNLSSYFWVISLGLMVEAVDLNSLSLKKVRFLTILSMVWSKGFFCFCSNYWYKVLISLRSSLRSALNFLSDSAISSVTILKLCIESSYQIWIIIKTNE